MSYLSEHIYGIVKQLPDSKVSNVYHFVLGIANGENTKNLCEDELEAIDILHRLSPCDLRRVRNCAKHLLDAAQEAAV